MQTIMATKSFICAKPLSTTLAIVRNTNPKSAKIND